MVATSRSPHVAIKADTAALNRLNKAFDRSIGNATVKVHLVPSKRGKHSSEGLRTETVHDRQGTASQCESAILAKTQGTILTSESCPANQEQGQPRKETDEPASEKPRGVAESDAYRSDIGGRPEHGTDHESREKEGSAKARGSILMDVIQVFRTSSSKENSAKWSLFQNLVSNKVFLSLCIACELEDGGVPFPTARDTSCQ